MPPTPRESRRRALWLLFWPLPAWLRVRAQPNIDLKRNIRLAWGWPRPNNVNKRMPDATNPSTKTAYNRMATETIGLVSNPLCVIWGGLPCTFHHTHCCFINYSSGVSSARWARVRVRAPDPSLNSLLGQDTGYRGRTSSSWSEST
jgi:hypothetical protein